MQHPIFATAVALLLLCSSCSATTSNSTAASILRFHAFVRQQTTGIVSVVPEPLRKPLAYTAEGFGSAAAFGAGVNTLLPAVSSVSSGSTLIDALQSNAVFMFFFATGSIAAELLCFAVFRPFVRTSAKNPLPVAPEFWVTHLGWLALVLVAAVPNGILDVSTILALVAGVPCDAYVSSLVVGKLLRPFVVAGAVWGVKSFAAGTVIEGALATLTSSASVVATETDSTIVALCFYGVVAAAALLHLVASVNDDEDTIPLNDEDE